MYLDAEQHVGVCIFVYTHIHMYIYAYVYSGGRSIKTVAHADMRLPLCAWGRTKPTCALESMTGARKVAAFRVHLYMFRSLAGQAPDFSNY